MKPSNGSSRPSQRQGRTVLSDTGPFSLVPEWLLDLPINDRSVRLYAVLGRYADEGTGESYPSRRLLAERLRCSMDSVDRALKELVDAGALKVEHRRSESGDLTSNLYTILRVRAEVATSLPAPSLTAAATGGGSNAARNENHIEREPLKEDNRLASLACSKKDEWLTFLAQLDQGRSQHVLSPIDNPEAYVTRCSQNGSSPPEGVDFDLLIEVGSAVVLGTGLQHVCLPKLEVIKETCRWYSRLRQALEAEENFSLYLEWATSQIRLAGSLSDPRQTLYFLTQTGVLPTVAEWRAQVSQPINSS